MSHQNLDFTDFQGLSRIVGTPDDYRKLLLDCGLLGKSFWKVEEGAISGVQRYMHGDANISESSDFCWPEEKLFSSSSSSSSKNANLPRPENVSSWKTYYEFRQLDQSNPISILLNPVLTLYHIIRNHISCSGRQFESLTIHFIGVEREVDLIPLFKELIELLPINIRLIMIGCNISTRLRNTRHVFECPDNKKLDVTIFQGRYEEFLTEIGKSPESAVDFALALNAGIGVCPDWLPALRKMKIMGLEFYATDFCDDAVNFSDGFLRHHKLGRVVNLCQNPFHSPIKSFLDLTSSKDDEITAPSAFSNQSCYSVEWFS